MSIFEPLHNFLTGPLVVKLRKEIEDLRVFNHQDLVANAYLLIMKFIGTLPDWHVRCAPRLAQKSPDIAIFQRFEIKAILQFIYALKPNVASFLPTTEIEDEITWLKQTLDQRAPANAPAAKPGSAGSTASVTRGYILAACDYDQIWFVPKGQEKENIFVLPVNCHDIPLHHIWRPKRDEMQKRLY